MQQTNNMVGCSVTSHINTVIRFFQKICSGTGQPVRPIDNPGTVPATEHDMLGNWPTSSPNRQSEDRPPSMICSGTGRPVHPIDNLGTIPTIEHDMLGDWSTSSPILTSLTFRKSGGHTNRRARRARGPVGCFHSVASKYDAPLAWKMQLHNV